VAFTSIRAHLRSPNGTSQCSSSGRRRARRRCGHPVGLWERLPRRGGDMPCHENRTQGVGVVSYWLVLESPLCTANRCDSLRQFACPCQSTLTAVKSSVPTGIQAFRHRQVPRFGTVRSEVQILSPRLTFPNDSPSRPGGTARWESPGHQTPGLLPFPGC
jgi:hypothetical protein